MKKRIFSALMVFVMLFELEKGTKLFVETVKK